MLLALAILAHRPLTVLEPNSHLGHISNEDIAEWLTGGFDGTARHIVLAHLSQRANNPYLAGECGVAVGESIATDGELSSETAGLECGAALHTNYCSNSISWRGSISTATRTRVFRWTRTRHRSEWRVLAI
jgi:hypothetical protein